MINTSVEKLTNLEVIERIVRQQMLEPVTPQVGIFDQSCRWRGHQSSPMPQKLHREVESEYY